MIFFWVFISYNELGISSWFSSIIFDNINFMEYCINKKDPLGIYPFIRTVNDFPIKGIKLRDITSLIEIQKLL